MKFQLSLLSILLSIQFYSQNIEGFIFNNNKKPLPLTNIALLNKKGGGTYSNKKGYFNFNSDHKKNDTILVSSVGFEQKKIIISSLKEKNIIILKEKTTNIDEIFLSFKKIKYNKKIKLGPKKNGNISSTKLIGFNTTTYIKNTQHKKGKLKTITLYLNKSRKRTSWKAPVFVAKFNMKIYDYDSINDKPGKELLHKNLIVEPKNKKGTLNIDVLDLNIIIPKNGICIGIEYIDENNRYKKYNHIGPALRYTRNLNGKNTWSNYRDSGWRKSSEKFRGYYENLMIKIEVLFTKKNI